MSVMLGLLAFASTPAMAQDALNEVAQDRPHNPAPRDLCSDRPGLNTPACTVDPGHWQVEVGVGDWALDRQEDKREDRVETGAILLRYGIGGTTEVRLGWTTYGYSRTRDLATGEVERADGTGDVTIGIKQNLRHPAEGKTGLAVALLPFVTIPTGHSDIGDGDWSAGLIVPASTKFSDMVSLELSPEIDAAANKGGAGRHLSYGAAMGVQFHLTKTVRLTPEVQLVRDDDPNHAATMSRASLSFDVLAAKMTQFDLQAIAGLNHDTPDVELAFGVTRKF